MLIQNHENFKEYVDKIVDEAVSNKRMIYEVETEERRSNSELHYIKISIFYVDDVNHNDEVIND